MKRNGKQNAELTEMAFWTHKFKNPLFLNKAGDTEESSRVRWSKFPHIPIYIPKTHLSLSLLCVFLALFTNSFGFLRMELDPDDVFRDDEDDADNELYRVFTFSLFSFCCESWVFEFWHKYYFFISGKGVDQRASGLPCRCFPQNVLRFLPFREFPNMPPHQFDDSLQTYNNLIGFGIFGWQGDQNDETHFQIAVSCISQSLKTQIINRSYDEVAICFFNTVR